MARHIGGSLLPSSAPHILAPIVVPELGTLQVRVMEAEDTHGLFRIVGDELFPVDEPELLAEHPNGYSCHVLAERIAKLDRTSAVDQAIYIVACGGRLTAAGATLLDRHAIRYPNQRTP